jgi:hypothetical protein
VECVTRLDGLGALYGPLAQPSCTAARSIDHVPCPHRYREALRGGRHTNRSRAANPSFAFVSLIPKWSMLRDSGSRTIWPETDAAEKSSALLGIQGVAFRIGWIEGRNRQMVVRWAAG